MTDDDTDLMQHFDDSDILYMADKLGFGDELRARLEARRHAFEVEHDIAPEALPAEQPGEAPPLRVTPRDADVEPPPPYELTFSGVTGGPLMLSGAAFAQRADYEAFIDAGGSVNTRGYAFELRGESLDVRTQRLADEAAAAAREARRMKLVPPSEPEATTRPMTTTETNLGGGVVEVTETPGNAS